MSIGILGFTVWYKRRTNTSPVNPMESRMETITYSPETAPCSLLQEIYQTRARQFVQRLQWDLCVGDAGEEKDEFDDSHAFYVVVRDNGRHVLSCRIRPASAGTMIEKYFAEAFPCANDFLSTQRESLWEVTRFCRCPEITTKESAVALRSMSFELDGFRDYVGAAGFIAAVYPHFPRFLHRLGARFLRLSNGIIQQEEAQMICVTHSVDFRGNFDIKTRRKNYLGAGVSFANQKAA